MAIAAATMALARPTSNALLTTTHRANWVFTPFAVSYSSSSSSKPSRALILYSKPGCCLCDGLKEKLQAAFLLSGPDSIHDVDLQVTHLTFVFSLNFKLQALSFVSLLLMEFVVLGFVQIRDITSNPEWERAYQYEIPVLARVLSDGSEETIPRLSPRLGVEMVQKKIAAALKH
ncbi:hypothetical protein ABKV19_018688 [Rosa sericea]